jgi:hypothetical protein
MVNPDGFAAQEGPGTSAGVLARRPERIAGGTDYTVPVALFAAVSPDCDLQDADADYHPPLNRSEQLLTLDTPGVPRL